MQNRQYFSSLNIVSVIKTYFQSSEATNILNITLPNNLSNQEKILTENSQSSGVQIWAIIASRNVALVNQEMKLERAITL